MAGSSGSAPFHDKASIVGDRSPQTMRQSILSSRLPFSMAETGVSCLPRGYYEYNARIETVGYRRDSYA